jgi:hypothetical protein
MGPAGPETWRCLWTVATAMLRAVADPVFQFFEQDIPLAQKGLLLLQQLLSFTLQGTPVGNVFDAQQNGRVRVAFVEHLASVQQHRALSDVGKLTLDLVTLHHALLRDDLFQAQSELRDVPLTVAQRI